MIATEIGKEYILLIKGKLVCESIGRHSNIKQAGVTYLQFEQWEKQSSSSTLYIPLFTKKSNFLG